MKPIISLSLLLIFFFFVGCEKNKIPDTTGMVGEWKLVEQKIGSAIIIGQPVVFEAVQSEKTISFASDGTYTSNGEMCLMSIESNSSSDGFFYDSLLSIEPEGCQFAAPTSGIKYQLDGDTLLIIYPCFEECVQKYYRI